MKTHQKVEEIAAIILLKKVKGFGPVKFRYIYEKFGSFSRFVDLASESTKSFRDVTHVTNMLGRKVWLDVIHHLKVGKREEFQRAALKQIRKAKEVNGHLITFDDEYYPKNLYRTNQCVPIIYTIGNVSILENHKFCAVVGTRNPSRWTIEETQRLVERLVNEDYVIVSGLAKGIDAICHERALDNYGKTIAVMGCGPDVFYPSENKDLQDRIKRSGLIISEYPFGSKVTDLSLKKRNKITVGLSDLVFITETSITGGTMNSYLAAVEQKKTIKIFLPFSDVGGDFIGNLRIYTDPRIVVERVPTGNEHNLDKLQHVKALIFDLDGTVWDSRNAIIATLNLIFKEKGMSFDESKVKKAIKYSESPLAILRSFRISEIGTFWKYYRRNYEKINLFSESTAEVLSRIAYSGRKIGVATALKGKIASELLEHFGLNSIVSVAVTPSDTRARKPSPVPILKAIDRLKVDSKQAIYIGDKDADILAAKAAGCFSGLAAWNRSVSTSEKPDYVFTSFEDLLLILK